MNNWDDLLLTGGFSPRPRLLQGLTLEQVGARPAGAPHSIYEELWHAAMCQKRTLEGGAAALDDWPLEDHFLENPAPESRSEWDGLVTMFLADSGRAARQADDAAWLESPESAESQWTRRNGLEFLAVHNAHHLGKLLLLRQIMGLWPPDDA